MATIDERVANAQSAYDAHLTSANPHHIDPRKLGLAGVKNFDLATVDQARAGDVNGRYLTPATLKEMFNGILMREGFMDANGNVI